MNFYPDTNMSFFCTHLVSYKNETYIVNIYIFNAIIMTIRLVSSTIPFPRTVMKHIVLKYVHSKPTISMKKISLLKLPN